MNDLVSAAAHRLSDTVRLAIVCGRAGGWLCVSLADGSTDGRVYDHHGEAVRWSRHQLGRVAYLKVPLDDLSPHAAEHWLDAMRKLADSGYPMADPDYPERSIITPTRREHLPR